MAAELEEVIKEVAEKNGISVPKDDPIMIMYTINQRLLENTKSAQEQLFKDFRAEVSEICVETVQEARESAKTVLNSSVQAAKNAFTNAINESAEFSFNNFSDKVDKRVSQITSGLEKPVAEMQRTARMQLYLTVASWIAAAGVIAALVMT